MSNAINSIKQQLLILEGIAKVCSDPAVVAVLDNTQKDSKHFESYYKRKIESLKYALSELESNR